MKTSIYHKFLNTPRMACHILYMIKRHEPHRMECSRAGSLQEAGPRVEHPVNPPVCLQAQVKIMNNYLEPK